MPLNNLDRATDVEAFLIAFAKQSGLNVHINADGPQTVAGDLIAHILHWVELNDPDTRAAALTAVKNGIGHYLSESYINYDDHDADELGPEAFIEINAACNGDNWLAQTGGKTAITATYPDGSA